MGTPLHYAGSQRFRPDCQDWQGERTGIIHEKYKLSPEWKIILAPLTNMTTCDIEDVDGGHCPKNCHLPYGVHAYMFSGVMYSRARDVGN
jgi:hypothetical protein